MKMKEDRASAEKIRVLEDSQKAILNVLEDFESEKDKLERIQNAMLNILDDFNDEKYADREMHMATLNILEDFEQEKEGLEDGLVATSNILEDLWEEKISLANLQQATLNILEDENREKDRAEAVGRELRKKNEQLKMADEEIRGLNITLQKRAVELEALNKELEAFSYSVSHDLRAPLRAIDGFSQAVLEDYASQLDETGQHYIQRMREGAQRMAHLIDDMLKLSRVTRAEVNRLEIDLSAMAREISSELSSAGAGREVEFLISPDLKVYGDQRLLRIALENLFSNSWKFTGPHDKARIEFGAIENDGQRTYYIRDDGVGFDMEYSDKLFGAFQRLHDTHEFPGTGIGLATVQRVISKHGGRIWAEGAVGKGAIFYFTLN